MALLRPVRQLLVPIALLAAAFVAPATAQTGPTPWWGWGNWAPFGVEPPKWDGQYLRMWTGVDVTSFRSGSTYAGPVIGVDAGKMWRDGDVVYGFAGTIGYMRPFVSGTNNSAFTEVTRDFGGAARFKFGYLAQPDLLLYSTVGVGALNETWRYPQAVGGGSDQGLVVRPEIGGGFEWALNDRTRFYGEIIVRPPIR